jgi:hypothetical protein
MKKFNDYFLFPSRGTPVLFNLKQRCFLSAFIFILSFLSFISPALADVGGCQEGEIRVIITITPDNFKSETTWELTGPAGEIASGGLTDALEGVPLLVFNGCLDCSSSYTFTIFDSFGDGICCAFGQGSYTITVDGQEVASGGDFESQEEVMINENVCSVVECAEDESEVVVTINTDDFGSETSWELTDPNGQVIGSAQMGDLASNTTYTTTTCVPCSDEEYTFTIFDSFDDGICCAFGQGSYTVTVDGQEVASGGEFDELETTSFSVAGCEPVEECPPGLLAANIEASYQCDIGGGEWSLTTGGMVVAMGSVGVLPFYSDDNDSYRGVIGGPANQLCLDPCADYTLTFNVFGIGPSVQEGNPLETRGGSCGSVTLYVEGQNPIVVTDYTSQSFTLSDDCCADNLKPQFDAENPNETIDACPGTNAEAMAAVSLMDADMGFTQPVGWGDNFMVYGQTFTAPTLAQVSDPDNPDSELLLYAYNIVYGATADVPGVPNTNLPCIRTIRIIWGVTDPCENLARYSQYFTIENQTPPTLDIPDDVTIACDADPAPAPIDDEEGEENAGLTTGTATASSICGVDVLVTHSDIVDVDVCTGGTITRTWTALDVCGKSSSDVQIITVDPALPPVITSCPGPQSVACPEDIVTTPGLVEVMYNCGVSGSVSVSGPQIEGPEGCPGSIYSYTYTATDECGRIAECVQAFTLDNDEDPTIEVVPNITVNCFESINPNPNFADVTTACGNGVDFSVAVTDPVLGSGLNCPGETYSVIYTITDACGRTADAMQTFTIVNDGPTMECPDNCEVLSCYDGDYNAVIEAWLNTVSASSSCSMELTVSNDYIGLEGICVGDFTPVTFTATDACGRTASCESGIYIVDTDAPDIIGEPSELLVPCTGVTEDIFADWLTTRGGIEAYDACYEDDITWSTNPANPLSLLDCSNGPQVIMVDFIATDGCGNSASVTGIFNTKLLPNAVNVAGLIQTEAAEAVSSVEVGAYQSSGMTAMDLSDNTGDYNFEELPYEEDTEIVPQKDNDYLNGLSTYDLIILQQHILGIQSLDSPYKRIAADANRSGTISTLDLVLLRRLILHVDEELADNTSWRFVDADFVFPNPENPFETNFPEAYMLIGEEEEWASFVAVKIGDLNLDAITNGLSPTQDRSSLPTLDMVAKDQKLETAQDYLIELSADNFMGINGFQFTLNFDQAAVEIMGIESADLADFNTMNYGMSKLGEGAVTISWHSNIAESLASTDAIFKVVLRANANVLLSEVLSISSVYTKAEAYQGGDLLNVSLNFNDNGTSTAAQALRLYQNQPNPFKNATMIGFDLPKAGAVDFMIYDLTGKLVYRAQGDFAAGYNQLELSRSDLPGGGVFYYHVNTDEDSASKKMIFID